MNIPYKNNPVFCFHRVLLIFYSFTLHLSSKIVKKIRIYCKKIYYLLIFTAFFHKKSHQSEYIHFLLHISIYFLQKKKTDLTSKHLGESHLPISLTVKPISDLVKSLLFQKKIHQKCSRRKCSDYDKKHRSVN